MTGMMIVTQEGAQLDAFREMLREYAAELKEEFCFQSFEAEVQDPLEKYVAPGGCILLGFINEQPAGCVTFRPLLNGFCEMKRLYVRPEYRKTGLGRELTGEIQLLAAERGFTKMRLDSLKRMEAAIRLYEGFMFRYIKPYYPNPLEDAVYMEKYIGYLKNHRQLRK